MGCNTSKETAPQNESVNKDNQEGSSEKSESKGVDGKTNDTTTENHVNDISEAKSPSARTITLRSSNDTSPTSPKDNNVSAKTTPDNSKPKTSLDEAKTQQQNKRPETPQEEKAATKIQAVFRGHKTRQSMKQPTAKNEATGGSGNAADEPTREQLEEEFRLDDVELCHAATKIQASFRGHMTRKQEAEKREETGPSQEKNEEKEEEELDIDLTDPDLNKAAVKIQASFRGHMVRKENEPEPTNSSN